MADTTSPRTRARTDRYAPAHLASWSIGADLDQDPITELDVEPGDGDADRLRARVAGLRALDPNRAVAVVHRGRSAAGADGPVGRGPGRSGPGSGGLGSGGRGLSSQGSSSLGLSGGECDAQDWRRQLASVVTCLTGRSDGFTGDTTPTSLARLRKWTDETLRRGAVPAAAVADIVLLVDELASNVEEHAPGWMTVDVEFGEHSVLVVVSDPQPARMPVPGDPPPEQPNGRGLLVVSALAVQWGVVLGRTSKAVWAEVDWPPVADVGDSDDSVFTAGSGRR